MEKINRSLEKIVRIGIKGSLQKQDNLFQASAKNRKLFEKAKLLAKY